jgi:hypothetical protein
MLQIQQKSIPEKKQCFCYLDGGLKDQIYPWSPHWRCLAAGFGTIRDDICCRSWRGGQEIRAGGNDFPGSFSYAEKFHFAQQQWAMSCTVCLFTDTKTK